ncbi:MAG: hypothetical protein AAGJ10_20845 [Bacteroidota bacterium]
MPTQDATHHLAAADPVLASIMASVPLPTLESTGNVFHDLVGCVVEQQIHYRSTKHTYQRMLDRAGIATLTAYTFPAFEANGLRTTKLSMRKYETLLAVVEHFSTHDHDWRTLTDAEVRRILGGIRGIGAWTIDMIMLYTLERPDVFPADDYHLKQLMPGLYDLNPSSRLKAQMNDVAADWAPYRSVATRYLLAWKTAQQRLPV